MRGWTRIAVGGCIVMLVSLLVLSVFNGWWSPENVGPEESVQGPDDPIVTGDTSSAGPLQTSAPAPGDSSPAQTVAPSPEGQPEPLAESIKRVKALVLNDLGAVEVLDSAIQDLPDRGEHAVHLVRKPGSKYEFLRVERPLTGARGQEAIMVADHVLVQFGGNPSPDQVRQMVANEGLEIRRKMIHDGLYIISAPEPTLDAVPDMISRLRNLNATVQVAEPDYMQFAR